MARYEGRTVVVTGGGSGLGAAMADRFAAEGARIALLDIDAARAGAKAAELTARGVDAAAFTVDVGDAASVAAAVDAVGSRFGPVSVVCANVGVQQFGAIDKLSEQDWAWVLSVNVMGTIRIATGFLRSLRAATGRRHVVLTASAGVYQPSVRMAAYAASKHAVVGFGDALRLELAPEGINVALLFPAGMTTRHLESSVAARPAALGPSRLDRADIDAMLAGAEIDAAAHLASPDHAVRNLLDDLDAGHRTIITHGGYRHQIEAQQAELLAAFDRSTAN